MHPPLSLLLLALIPPLLILAVLAARRLARSRRAGSEPPVEVGEDGGEESVDETQDSATPSQAGTEQPSNTAAIEKNILALANTMRTLSSLTVDLYEKRRTLASNTVDPAHDAQNGDTMASRHYLTFALGEERFAISMLHVGGALKATQLIADPALPSKVRRAIKLGGSLVPVIDLRVRLGGQPVEIGWSTRIVLLELLRNGIQQTVGVMVDAVGRIVEIDPTDIEPLPAGGTHIHSEFVLGLGRSGDLLVILLDIERVLSAGRLALPVAHAPAMCQEQWLI